MLTAYFVASTLTAVTRVNIVLNKLFTFWKKTIHLSYMFLMVVLSSVLYFMITYIYGKESRGGSAYCGKCHWVEDNKGQVMAENVKDCCFSLNIQCVWGAIKIQIYPQNGEKWEIEVCFMWLYNDNSATSSKIIDKSGQLMFSAFSR